MNRIIGNLRVRYENVYRFETFGNIPVLYEFVVLFLVKTGSEGRCRFLEPSRRAVCFAEHLLENHEGNHRQPKCLECKGNFWIFLLSIFEEQNEITSSAALDSLDAIVLSLSDSMFRSIFTRIYHWTLQSKNKTDLGNRLITFYRITNRFTETLKQLFTIFAGTVVSHAAKTMNALHVGRVNRNESDDISLKQSTKLQLLMVICEVLSKFFKYDVQGEVIKGDSLYEVFFVLTTKFNRFHLQVWYFHVGEC